LTSEWQNCWWCSHQDNDFSSIVSRTYSSTWSIYFFFTSDVAGFYTFLESTQDNWG
jgi:hypothetical protein